MEESTQCRLTQIGGALSSGQPHDGRAPDYDDWQLNGGLPVWNPALNRSFEISSMGNPYRRGLSGRAAQNKRAARNAASVRSTECS